MKLLAVQLQADKHLLINLCYVTLNMKLLAYLMSSLSLIYKCVWFALHCSYLKSRFVLDVLGCLPLDAIYKVIFNILRIFFITLSSHNIYLDLY